MKSKLQKLIDIIKESKKCVIAFSGGTDSTLLLKLAADILGEDCLAVTICGPLNPKSEIEEAVNTAKKFGVRHKIVKVDISNFDWFENNPKNRCYICKTRVFKLIKEESEKFGTKIIFDGTNIDDLSDYRPGLKALNELEIRSPLREAELKKQEIREISKEYEIDVWNKPSFTCLATRFPTGSRITVELLEKVEKCEEYLKQQGFRQFRVRVHENLARIEFEESEIERAFEKSIRVNIDKKFKETGFRYVAIDISGYKSGNMN